MTDAVFAYVGIRECGCMVAAAVDKPQYAKDNAKTVAEWMRDGLTVERVPIERVRAEFKSCEHHAKKPQQLTLKRKDR